MSNTHPGAPIFARKPTLVELDGEVSELQAVESVAPSCGYTIEPGPDQRLGWLAGSTLDATATPQEARTEAAESLIRLNGLARLRNPRHRNVELANAVYQGGRMHYHAPHWESRPGTRLTIASSPLTGAMPKPPVDPRLQRLVTDPKLADIVEVFSREISWQRLRVAFEKINALVGKGDNALVKHAYATQADLTRLKENMEDPRISGPDAVHGVPRGPLKGDKMTEVEGFDLLFAS